jgi:hypothetical protein
MAEDMNGHSRAVLLSFKLKMNQACWLGFVLVKNLSFIQAIWAIDAPKKFIVS